MHPLCSPGEISHPFCTPTFFPWEAEVNSTPGKHSEVLQAATQEQIIEYFVFSKAEAELLRDQEPCPR